MDDMTCLAAILAEKGWEVRAYWTADPTTKHVVVNLHADVGPRQDNGLAAVGLISTWTKWVAQSYDDQTTLTYRVGFWQRYTSCLTAGCPLLAGGDPAHAHAGCPTSLPEDYWGLMKWMLDVYRGPVRR